MLFTWSTDNLCIIFRQWHITSTTSLAVSLLAIVAICAGYEALRDAIRRYETVVSKRVDTAPRKFCLNSCSIPHLSPLHLAKRRNLSSTPTIITNTTITTTAV